MKYYIHVTLRSIAFEIQKEYQILLVNKRNILCFLQTPSPAPIVMRKPALLQEIRLILQCTLILGVSINFTRDSPLKSVART